jgi:DNA-binding GntR family transcriptional regulator
MLGLHTRLEAPVAAANTITAQIIDAILSQRLTPGTRMGEQDLAALFGCSRTIVREALVDLAARGIAAVSPRRGWYLTEVDAARARELYTAREIIETGLLRELGRRNRMLDGPALARIESHLAAQADAVAGSDVPHRSYLLGDFHVCLANSLGNSVLAGYLRDLTVLTTLFTMRYQSPNDAQRSYDEHVAVFEALARGDTGAAEDAMRRHLRTWEEKVQLAPAADPLAHLRSALSPRSPRPPRAAAGAE